MTNFVPLVIAKLDAQQQAAENGGLRQIQGLSMKIDEINHHTSIQQNSLDPLLVCTLL